MKYRVGWLWRSPERPSIDTFARYVTSHEMTCAFHWDDEIVSKERLRVQ